MNTFEKMIRDQQIGRSEHLWPTSTIGDLVSAVLSIHDRDTALAFKTAYVEHVEREVLHVSRGYDALSVVDANIGWCFGEGMDPKDIAMWASLGASHPVFGTNLNHSPEEILKMGMERGKRNAKN